MISGFRWCAAVLFAPALAAAQPVTGAYVSLGGGADFLQNEILKPYNGFGPVKRAYTFTPGGAAQASAGYGFGNGLRIEAEGDYAYSHVRGVKSAVPLRAGGQQQQYGGFLNALFDLDIGLAVYPYLGAGIGYQRVELDNVNSTAPGAVVRPGSQGEGSFAYRGIAGLSYPVSFVPGLSLTAEYRMIGVTTPPAYLRGPASGNVVNGQAMLSRATINNIFNHEALAGLRYVFNAAPLPAVEPEPAPPPHAEAARTYLVFFDWDRADLTGRARQIIAEAANGASRVAVTRIEVSGHTDTTGTARYNEALSVRRAQAVAGELVRLGVPRATITTLGFGFSRPLVATGAGVREAQNRRVEIVLR